MKELNEVAVQDVNGGCIWPGDLPGNPWPSPYPIILF
jgi:hypothetical protein